MPKEYNMKTFEQFILKEQENINIKTFKNISDKKYYLMLCKN